ncbi:MAG: ABC transporter ATP-binding protein [Anaerovoracaceae bacterium]
MTENNTPLLRVDNLTVHFDMKSGFFSSLVSKEKKVLKAVDGVSFDIEKGEILSLVGESGSGKTTTGKAILNLVSPTGGTIEYNGKTLGKTKEEINAFRQSAQMIFQDPYQSLNPRHYIIDIVAEPLDVNGLVDSTEEREARVKMALEQAGLTPAEDYFYRYPYELSGGQRQRVVIAGALILEPKFIVADEPVSMLDASIRTGILRLMMKMRDEKGIAYLFITHDLSLAWLISDRIAIIYLGKIMEIGGGDEIINEGIHPYTKALMAIMPRAGQRRTQAREVLEGETPNAAVDIQGCKFCSRCPIAKDICRQVDPQLVEVSKGHLVACHNR